MSASTSTFCLSTNSTDGVTSGPDMAHARQMRHVWMMCTTIAITTCGSDAALKIFSMADLGACHQRRCNFRTSSFCWFSVPLRRIRRLLSMLKFDQSVSTLSIDCGISGNLSCWSGPRVALGAEVEPLLGPEVSSRGGGSTSGMSGAEAFPDGSCPMGTGASLG